MATLQELLGENYRDGMSLEDVESAISGMKLADLTKGEYVSKGKALDYEKRMKDAEKKLAEKLTDEERAQAEREERERYYADLEKQLAISKYEKELSFMGDSKLISEVATLYANGDIINAIKKIGDYKSKADVALVKQTRENLMQENPQSNPQTNGSVGKTKEEIMAIKDPVARQSAIAENISLFQK